MQKQLTLWGAEGTAASDREEVTDAKDGRQGAGLGRPVPTD